MICVRRKQVIDNQFGCNRIWDVLRYFFASSFDGYAAPFSPR
jgi:hypothetical protein